MSSRSFFLPNHSISEYKFYLKEQRQKKQNAFDKSVLQSETFSGRLRAFELASARTLGSIF